MGLFSKKTDEDETGELQPTPWAWRTVDGIYVSRKVNKLTGQPASVWLYRVVPTQPLAWEPVAAKIGGAQALQSVLEEVGSRSKARPGKSAKMSDNREVHVLAISWEAPATPSNPATPELAQYQMDAFGGFLFPKKALFIGVKLESPILDAIVSDTGDGFFGSLKANAKKLAANALGEAVPDLSLFQKDIDDLEPIFRRNFCSVPTAEQTAQLESWFNLGQGPEKTMIEQKDHIIVDGVDKLEFNILMGFSNPIMHAPGSDWLYEAMTHYSPARVVSLRAQLEPSDVSRERARRSQRRVLADIEEQQTTSELERSEYGSLKELAKSFEDLTVSSQQPLLTRTSVIMARRAETQRETFKDALSSGFGIQVKPLEHRQMWALEHTLPCSKHTLDIFPQDLSISMVAHSGVWGFEQFGDGYGSFVGLDHTTFTPTFQAAKGPKSASNRNGMGPITITIGEPGSGKTFFLQNQAVQYALDGLDVIMIDPKVASDLSPTAELIESRLGPGTTEQIALSKLEKKRGELDPFRWALGEGNEISPIAAAEVLADFITSVLQSSLSRADKSEIAVGLKNAAEAGARCAMHALAGIENKELVALIQNEIKASSLVGLAFGETPQPPLSTKARFTLIQFDRKLQLPSPSDPSSSWEPAEARAMAVNRLVFRSMLETLTAKGGGVLIMDEAWTFLSHPSSMAAIEQLGREGRSLNVLLMLATQKIADVLADDRDLESFISRVYIMKMADPNEITASLRLMKMEDSPAVRKFIEDAAPRRNADGTQRPAMGLIRDADGRYGALVFGPTPFYAAEAFSTRPDDVKRRADRRKAQVAAALAYPPPSGADSSPSF